MQLVGVCSSRSVDTVKWSRGLAVGQGREAVDSEIYTESIEIERRYVVVKSFNKNYILIVVESLTK